MKKNLITTAFDGLDASANVLSLIHPVFASLTIITFVIRRIIGFTDEDDIIKRMKKIENKLLEKKIGIEEFKEKMIALSNHNIYIVKNNLNNILLNTIPESVDYYISLWIDLIMNQENSIYEELCEILNDLNKNDIILLKKIKEFLESGEREYYIKTEIERKEREKESRKKSKEIQEYNAKTKGIKKLNLQFHDRDVRIGEKTIFWKDFSKYYNVNIAEMGFLMLTKEKDDKLHWEYIVRSFAKLDRLGVLQLDYYNTLNTINSLNIDRFHITLFGKKLLEYIPKENDEELLKK